MMDILSFADGEDITITDNILTKAKNVLSVQSGALEYAPDFGIDITFFLFSPVQMQNEAFKSHIIERLLFYYVNISEITEVFEDLYSSLTIGVSDTIASIEETESESYTVNILTNENGDAIETEDEEPIEV